TDAFDNQDYPFDNLVEELDIKRDLSKSPLFDVMVILQNNEAALVNFDGLNLSPYYTENKISKYDMTFSFSEGEEGLYCSIEYNTDIYAEDRIERMGEHFKTLISSVIENAVTKIKDLNIIPEEERNLLLDVFNDSKTDYPKDKTIVDLFEEQVEKTPDNIAVVFENVELTYKDLNEKANIVGHYLRNKYDIEPDDLVGVLLERSEKIIIALLGILKSGAAYVPIDPGYPEERIKYMLVDSKPQLVLSGQNEGIFADINLILESGNSRRNLEKVTSSKDLAYVIYTSGSTGEPKGTFLSNRSVVNFIKGMTDRIDFKPDKAIVSVTTFSFDIFVTESFLPLAVGQKIILANKEQQTDPYALKNVIEKNKVDMIQTTPSRIKMLTSDDFLLKTLSNLTEIMVGGEVFPEDLLETLNKYCNGKIYNMYGPTETTVWSTLALLNEDESVHIGKPIANTRINIFDKDRNLVPVGVYGELHIGGDGLSTGYLNRPELTNKKFIANPFNTSEKMYRTGDLARWLTCGNIEFLGRIDNQVKIRGFRIELGEIENSFVQHKEINSAVVVAKKGIEGDEQLVAYYVSDQELELSELRSFLRKSLPDYMIPSYFINMDVLPLTANGKIDRKSLPEIDGSISSGVEYVAPRDDIEKTLAIIWQEVLGIEKVGVLDNFFELGGHSLKATRVVSQIIKKLEIDIVLTDIFKNQTVEALSILIVKAKKKVYKQIEVVAEQDTYEISNAQRRLWILDQFEEGSMAYNLPAALVLKGQIQIDTFKKAYSFLIERHESLRTIFIANNGEPRQKILKNPSFDIELIDLRGNPDREEKARVLAENDVITPFNLESGPLVRFSIIQIEDDKILLLFNMHHIIFDGWSMNIFIREFLNCYHSFREGVIPKLKSLRIHYKDYSAWQNELLESDEIKSQKEYWLEKLSGEMPVLDFPSDKIRPAFQTFGGSSKDFSFSKDIKTALKNLCRENNISLFMMLQALVKVLFYRYTGQSDIILGSPVAGRVHEDLEGQIGFYVNTIALRDTIEGDSSFNKILADVGRTCAEAFDNQTYPFDRIVEDLDIKRDLSRSPLFDVMVVLQNNETSSIEFKGLELIPYVSDDVISKFDMTFSFLEGDEELYCSIEYNTDLYMEDRIDRIGEHLKTLISSVIENTETKVKDLQIIPEDEMNLLLNVFNDTKADYPKDKTIVDLFEEQVEKTPDNIAVIFEDIELTYRELNGKVNIVGHFLQDNYDLKPDDLVGVLLERSEKMIIALLGIMKSGAAYVPIDPEYPEERINYILDDATPDIVLCERDDGIYVDIKKVLESDKSKQNPMRTMKAENLAYVIYTSGSTGKPKGTLIEHGSLVNRLNWMQRNYPIGSNDAILQKTTYTFDVSVWELFWWSLYGSKVCILNPGEESDPELIVKKIEKHNISTIHFVPSMYSVFLHYLRNNNLFERIKSLKQIFSSGEELSIDLVGRSKAIIEYNKTKLVNLYGPTEATIDVTYFNCDIFSESIPIGKPIFNTTMYIIDKEGRIVPLGIAGELCISGAGLAREYLNKPELTAEKFVGNPFNPGERMYRTGDLARWLPDGNIEFLGRIDNQVKIRGFRIELGEIENVLLKHIGITSALVLVKGVIEGEKHLISYYVSDIELEISELRNFLKKFLPEYMVPAYFIHLESFPLTTNGKIDRKALPELDGTFNTGVEYVAPRNKTEEKIVEIWQDVLGLENIGIHDNFFELGGNSLKLIKLSSQINKELDLDISVIKFYTYTSIQSFVENVFEGSSTNKINNKVISKTVGKASQDIAIIGMSGRFPGAANIAEFWNNLEDGIESISRFTKDELLEAGLNKNIVDNPNFIQALGVVKGKEFFDAGFFGYSPSDAEVMNPQIRIFHEDAWAALEDGGYNSDNYSGSIGVFAGGSQNIDWIARSSFSDFECSSMEISQLSDSSFMSSRISHKLNLRGPSYYTNTACSTSLVNIIIACENLINRRCDMALAGGIRISAETKSGYMYSEGSISSPDGHCRAFSNDAAGTVGGEGSGVVLLKMLDEALRDNDNIHAVIKGYGTNNDGKRKVGYTAPSVLGQAELIKDIQQRAGINPESITYIEAHGTGTIMGDPIEIEALKMAFDTDKKQFCGIGSVKSNIGHLDSAAGIAGVIKTVMSLKNRKLPPTLYADISNPLLKIEESPFYINKKLKNWESDGSPLRAGVSSFGIGGTNAHIVLEEAPQIDSSKFGKSFEIINFSAKTKSALDNYIRNFRNFLINNEDINLYDLSYTLNVGRKHFEYRCSFVVSSIEELNQQIVYKLDYPLLNNPIKSEMNKQIIFMFPGQGSQYKNMGFDLYNNDELFKIEVDNCIHILNQERDMDFKEVLFGGRDINESGNSSCALFIIEYALSKLLKVRGINPDVMIGHSLGEYTAACISGVLSLKDTLTLVYDRGLLIKQLSPGSMLSVFIEKDILIPLLDDTVSLAVDNSDSLVVISGSIESIEKFDTKLDRLGYTTKRINSNHAFHSYMLDPIINEYKKILSTLDFEIPQIPYISNVTGEMIRSEEVKSIDYWVKHFRGTVEFNSGVKELLKNKNSILVEVGPGKNLTSLVNSNASIRDTHRVVNTLQSPLEELNDYQYFQNKISELWMSGAIIDWRQYYSNEERRRISLPTYAFDKTYFGKLFNVKLDDIKFSQVSDERSINNKPLTYLQSWERVEIPQTMINENFRYLIFLDELGVSDKLINKLVELGSSVIIVKPGNEYTKIGENEYIINHKNENDYCKLFHDISHSEIVPDRIIHSWSLQGEDINNITIDSVHRENEFGLYSAFYIAKAISIVDIQKNIKIYFLSLGIHNVFGFETLSPGQSLILAALKVISTEFPNIECKNLDLKYKDIIEISDHSIEQIINEINSPIECYQVAYRKNTRWILTFKNFEIEKYSRDIKIKKGGVYLITGGLGGFGITFSRYIAKEFNVKLVLTTRTNFPDRSEWNGILKGVTDCKHKSKIKDLIEIEKSGSDLLVYTADVSDKKAMEKLVVSVEAKWGSINGIIHTAGIADGNLIQLRKKSDIEEILKSKIDGTIILTEIFKKNNLDFMILCSSMTSLSGGLGQFAYTAANQFLDSFADYYRLKGNNITSINWPVLLNDGMLANSSYYSGDEKFLDCINPYEGIEVLKMILETDFSNVSVSKIDINALHKKNRSFNKDEILYNNYKENHPRPDICTEYIPATNDIEEAIIEIWKDVLGIEKIGINDDFFDLGGHSLKAVTLISKFHNHFDYQLQLGNIFENPTVADLAELICNRYEPKEYDVLAPIQKKGSNPPIFLFPGEGGEVHYFSALSKALGDNQPVYGFKSLGLDGISDTIDSIEELADIYIKSIKSVQENGPYTIGGHSFGGCVAFEVVSQLENNGDSVENLFLFDSIEPNLIKSNSFDDEKIISLIIDSIANSNNLEIEYDASRIAKLSEYDRWIYLERLFAENNLSYFIDMFKGKWNVMRTATNNVLHYNPKIILENVKIILFKANRRIKNRELEEGWNKMDYGWNKLTDNEIQIYEISGNHNSMLAFPNVKEIADVIMSLDKSKQKILSK
ncbi:MAG: amino acid adenylation domain-containing protein, partial [Deltaproteobacteria bacterium]|nr:amino acid adenylation domain-containing protein [Deltaproteobacteria bacterium]